MIFQTQQIVEANFDAKVIYGDTDSVMVKLNGIGDIGEALRIGQEMESMVNKVLRPPNELELEKVYKPYLLMSKKRYIGKVTPSGKKSPIVMDQAGQA